MLKCNLCEYIAKSEQNLKYHLLRKHTKIYMGLYYSECYEKFHKMSELCDCVSDLVRKFINR